MPTSISSPYAVYQRGGLEPNEVHQERIDNFNAALKEFAWTSAAGIWYLPMLFDDEGYLSRLAYPARQAL
jgi:hypothetical protein